jgi:hypothetical protein
MLVTTPAQHPLHVYKRHCRKVTYIVFIMPFQPSSTSIHEQFHLYTATEDAARTFLFSTGILRSQMSCSCLTPMDIVTCTASKSEDLKIWRCTSCRKFRNIRSDSVLARSNLSFKQFLTLMYYFSSKSLTNVEIAGFTALSEKAVGHWRHVLNALNPCSRSTAT